MSLSDAERVRIEQLKQASELLENHPDYAKAQVDFFERASKLTWDLSAKAQMAGTDERLLYVTAMFDLWAETHIGLVSDITSQKAFAALIHENLRYNWQQFTGRLYDDAPTQSFPGKADDILQRVTHWITESYRRASKRPDVPSVTPFDNAHLAARVPSPRRVSRDPQPELLQNQEYANRTKAAKALGTTTRTIDRWTADGKLVAYGVGVRKRFNTRDLLRLLNEKKEGQKGQE